MQSIEWRPIPGYEGYYDVSSDGQVRRVGAAQGARPGRILSQATDPRGYRRVHLHRDNSGRTVLVHQLVARAFIGEPSAGQTDVCHWNGNPADNRFENLRWGTRSDNMQDAVRLGENRNSSKTHCDRGHEFTPDNTRYAKNGQMRVCISCRKRKEPCPVCGEMRSYYGMKSHLAWVHGK